MRDGQIISDERRRKRGADGSARAAGAWAHARAMARSHDGSGRRHGLGVRLMISGGRAAGARRATRCDPLLTMLGVFIGVAALIAMVAVGQGANEAVRKQIESLGTNLLVVVPGATTVGRLPRRVRQRLDPDRRRRQRRSAAKRRRSVSVSYLIRQMRPGSIRQQELDDQHPGRQRQLSSDHQLADRRPGAGSRRRTRSSASLGRRSWPDSLSAAVRHQRESDRRPDPGEERTAARDRHSRLQGANAVRDRIRTTSS